MRAISAILAAALLAGCGASAPTVPSFELPSIDTSALQRLLDDAIAEAQQIGETASVDLPAALAETLEANNIELPAIPANAAEMCSALGTPGASSEAGAVLRGLIQSVVEGGEVGLAIGLLTTVVFTTCPIWSPHLEDVVEQFL